MSRVAVFGLGEAGGLIAGDLAKAGLTVTGYDPAPVNTPAGVSRYDDPGRAVSDADVVIGLAAAADAAGALEQAFFEIPSTALYADFSTAPASLKRSLARRASERDIAFADVALLSVVVGLGIRTGALVSGTGAVRFVEFFRPLGMPVDSLGDEAGDAATRKLLRSVFMKGLAGVVIEAMRAAERAGLARWLWENLSEEIARADGTLLRRLVSGTGLHAGRRLHEMESAADLLEDLGVDPVMTRSTIGNLHTVLAQGIPAIPTPGDEEAAPKPVGK